MPSINRQVRLIERPVGIPEPRHFELTASQVLPPADGQVLIRNLYLSIDPAMRGWVQGAANYAKPVAIGDVMKSYAVGEIVESRHADYAAGDLVTGLFGWQEWTTCSAAVVERKLAPDIFQGIAVSAALGVLGLTGVTAYFGLMEVGAPKVGDTVVVSAGAGSVGSCVGQLAKIAGCRTVAIVGSPEKSRLALDQFGYDAAISYRSPDFAEEFASACPKGIDVYFDNTAGISSDVAMELINARARVVICGTIAHTEWSPPPMGPRVNRQLLVNRARMEGFIAPDYQARWPEALHRLAGLIAEGKLKYKEEILDGIEAAPASIAGLYRGDNVGKRIIRL